MDVHFCLFSMIGFIYLFSTTNVLSATSLRGTRSSINNSLPEITVDGIQDDILIDADEYERKQYSPSHARVPRALTDPRLRWPTRNIPYTIEPYVYTQDEINTIQGGLEFLRQYTCLTFELVEPADPRFKIYVSNPVPNGGCSSPLGYQQQIELDNGRPTSFQTLSLGPGCVTIGTVQHEFMHSLGLIHEQCRPDRDSYVNIHWNRIPSNLYSQFYVISPSTTYDLPYDYGSAMHYENNIATVDGYPTIEAKDNRICLGNRIRATACDILKLNLLYGCIRKGERTCEPFVRYRDPRTGICPYP